jgi:adenosylhomocysteine nucleosidase
MFQWLLQSWLERLAQEKIRQTVVRAARERFASTAARSEPPAERGPCDVGLVFALEMESGGLEDRLQDLSSIHACGFAVRLGQLHGRQLVLVRSGAGRAAAAKATAALLNGHQPALVISAGFAGGLDPALARGDILLAEELVDTAGNVLPVELPLERGWFSSQQGLHLGRLLTADRIVRLPEEKRALGRKHQALAIDMETFAVAQACRDRQTRFLAVRVVTDAVDETLPADLEHLLQQKSAAARWGAALGSILDRPGSVKDLYRLKESALLAGDCLAKFLERLIVQLVPEKKP